MNPILIQAYQLTTDYKELVEHLARKLALAKLAPQGDDSEQLADPIRSRYSDYRHTVGALLLITQSTHRTRAIVTAVLDQALALGKTAGWVEGELTFEGMVEGADRGAYLRLELEQTARDHHGMLHDHHLDNYNDRLHRFPQDDPSANRS